MMWLVVYLLGFGFALWAIIAPWEHRFLLAVAWPLPITAFVCKWTAISLIWLWHKFGGIEVENN